MKAVQLEAGCVTVVEREIPAPPAGHVLLKLRVAGICNTDLELQRGYYGFAGTPGHEFVAEEVETGRRVVGEINLACGECAWCRRGLGRHCPNRTVLGIVKHAGAFAEYLTLPRENLFAVPDSLSDEEAVFVEPVAAACEILEQAPQLPREAAVLGDGKLGLLIAQVLQLSGVQVRLFGRHEEKMRIAEAVGVRRGEGGAFDLVVEATGSAGGLRQAVGLTRPRGVIVMKSTVAEPVALDMAPVIVNEITLLGSRCGRFEAALPLLGRLNLKPMIQARYRLAEAPAAFERAARRGTLKVLLEG